MNGYDDILCHHGIKGQKWGIRRYQNPDGSLTEAGKAKKRKLIERGSAGQIYRNRRLFTPEEIRGTTFRLQQEQNLRNLRAQHRNTLTLGEQYLKRFGTVLVGTTLVVANMDKIASTINNVVGKDVVYNTGKGDIKTWVENRRK